MSERKLNIEKISSKIEESNKAILDNIGNRNKDKDTNIRKSETLEDIMRDIEQKTNPKSLTDSLILLSKGIQNKDNSVSVITNPISDAFTEFEQRTGRNMTYAEMRMMMG